MYSLEQRTDAIQLFIESGFNENAVIRSLGYPSPTMTIDCLDRDTIRRYRQRMDNLRPGHVWSELAVEDFLHRIGAMARDADGKLRPTAAGLLMFGHEYEIVREFPHYFLDYQEHDRSVTEDERWTDRIVSSSGDWSGNICDFYFRVYNRIAQDIKVPFKLEGTDRIDDTPLHKALREALANALILNIINSISMSVSARMKQYGILRAIGMDDAQLKRMISAEAGTYAVSGLVVGIALGLVLNRKLYILLITHYFGAAWQVPWGCLAVIVAVVLAAVVLAVYTPVRRILMQPITATISEL